MWIRARYWLRLWGWFRLRCWLRFRLWIVVGEDQRRCAVALALINLCYGSIFSGLSNVIGEIKLSIIILKDGVCECED